MEKEPVKVGRPLKFSTAEELQAGINSYFADCTAHNKPLTVTGLALFLDTSRDLLCDYGNKPEFAEVVKMAKLRVENYAEEKLYSNNVTGAIFALKNFGWSDKQDVNIGGQNGKNPLETRSKVVIELVRADTGSV